MHIHPWGVPLDELLFVAVLILEQGEHLLFACWRLVGRLRRPWW